MEENRASDCGAKKKLSVWYCEVCKSVHFRLGEKIVTFSAEEFIDFASSIGDIYGQAYFEVFKEKRKRDYWEFDLIS